MEAECFNPYYDFLGVLSPLLLAVSEFCSFALKLIVVAFLVNVLAPCVDAAPVF